MRLAGLLHCLQVDALPNLPVSPLWARAVKDGVEKLSLGSETEYDETWCTKQERRAYIGSLAQCNPPV